MAELSLSADVQKRLREFFHSNVDMNERGCLLTKAGELVPIENLSSHPEVEIRPSEADFIAMVMLLQENQLDAWVHSHPKWRAFPSPKDVMNHNVPCDMIIYSGLDGSMNRYTSEQLQEYKKQLTSSSLTRKECKSCQMRKTSPQTSEGLPSLVPGVSVLGSVKPSTI